MSLMALKHFSSKSGFRRAGIAAMVCVLLLPVVCCSAEQKPSKPLKVVASIRPLALLAQDLLGDLAEVQVIVPPNADPHNLSLKISDRVKLDGADIVFWLGPEFERFLNKAIKQRNQSIDLAIVAELEDSVGQSDEHHEHVHDGSDTHVWMDPGYALLAVKALSERVERLRPELKLELSTRLAALNKQIQADEQSVSERLHLSRSVKYVVMHDAYSHFSEAFGLSSAIVVNKMPEQRLSAKQLYKLQQGVEGARCLLVEGRTDRAFRLAKVLNLDTVDADPLASNENIKSYSDFLLGLGGAFERCLNGRK